MELIEILVIVLTIGYFVYIIFETIMNNKYRHSFKYVIHVNGIRGKSTTTRLIDAGFRNCGYKVFSKTTGTIATMIDTNNNDIKVKRIGTANIREQLQIIKQAYKEHAEVLVLECMAVNPQLQKICEEKIVKSDVTVITNVRLDHIMDMGDTLDDLALAFCNTIPTHGHLVINPGPYAKLFEEKGNTKGTTVHVAKEYTGNDDLNTFKENIALALEVAKTLDLDIDKFFEGMKNYHQDIGAFETIKFENTVFLNGLSINDPMSIKVVYNEVIKKYDYNNLTILLNNRNDRPTRVLQHIELMSELPCKKLLIFGSNPNYVKKALSKKAPQVNVEILEKIEDLKKENIVFAIGNIGGKGMKVLEYFRNNGDRI